MPKWPIGLAWASSCVESRSHDVVGRLIRRPDVRGSKARTDRHLPATLHETLQLFISRDESLVLCHSKELGFRLFDQSRDREGADIANHNIKL